MRLAQLIYLMLPVYMANMAPPFVRFWHGWNRPIDARLLGSHKTVIGFAAGIAAAVATSFVQSRIGWEPGLLAPGDWLAAGVAAGTGAMAGDSLKSLVKRRIGIAPGERWIPFDQLDFVAGGLIALAPFVRLAWFEILAIGIFSFAADIGVNHLSWRLRIRETKW